MGQNLDFIDNSKQNLKTWLSSIEITSHKATRRRQAYDQEWSTHYRVLSFPKNFSI